MLSDQNAKLEEMIQSGFYNEDEVKYISKQIEYNLEQEIRLRNSFYVGDLMLVFEETKNGETRH